MKLLDKGYLNLITAWGSDEEIICAARMSTDGGFKGWGPIHDGGAVCSLHPTFCRCKLKEGDEKLLRFLWTNKHTSPFEQCGFTVEVYAPIFVVREWVRHRTQSFNEMSGRYTVLPDDYYVPSVERLMAAKQSTVNKQSSTEGLSLIDAEMLQTEINDSYRESRKDYKWLLERKVAREIARMVLPVAQYSRFRASANLRNWLHFLELRLAEDAQWEIRQYAKGIATIIEEKFPRTFTLFSEDQ